MESVQEDKTESEYTEVEYTRVISVEMKHKT